MCVGIPAEGGEINHRYFGNIMTFYGLYIHCREVPLPSHMPVKRDMRKLLEFLLKMEQQ